MTREILGYLPRMSLILDFVIDYYAYEAGQSLNIVNSIIGILPIVTLNIFLITYWERFHTKIFPRNSPYSKLISEPGN